MKVFVTGVGLEINELAVDKAAVLKTGRAEDVEVDPEDSSPSSHGFVNLVGNLLDAFEEAVVEEIVNPFV